MTTINNYNDFLEALGNNRQWRDAMRAQILSEDLLQLPVNFEAFTEEQKAQSQKFDTFAQEHGKRLENIVQKLNTRTTNLEERVGPTEGDTGTLNGGFART